MKTATAISYLEAKTTAIVGVAMSGLHAMGLNASESLLLYIVVATVAAALAVYTAGEYTTRERVISMLRSVPIGFAFAAVGLWAVDAFTDWPPFPEGIVAAIFFFTIYYGQSVARLIQSALIGAGIAIRDGEAIKDRISKK